MTHTKDMMTLATIEMPVLDGTASPRYLVSQLMGWHPWRNGPNALLALWREHKEDPCAFFAPLMGEDREGYIAHRDALKLMIRTLAEIQKQLAIRMRMAGGDQEAQILHAIGAHAITALIEIRRAGKDWSRARRGARDAQGTASAA